MTDPAESNLRHAQQRYGSYTVSASGVIRTLAISGVGILWLFGTRKTGGAVADLRYIESSPLLTWVLACFLLALIADVAQYVIAAMLWGSYAWSLNEIIYNDKAADIRIPGRYAWRVAKRFRAMPMIAEFAGSKVSTSKKFKHRRDELRRSIRDDLEGGYEALAQAALKASVNHRQSPPSINMITATLFFGKGVAVALAYIFLAIKIL